MHCSHGWECYYPELMANAKPESHFVRVENVSIDRLHDFLKRIEEGNDLVKVRELQIETRFDNAKMLNAKVTVGTFKTTEI